MKVGLDLDGCVYPFSLVVNKVLTEQFGYEDIGEWQCWDFPTVGGGIAEDHWKWCWTYNGKQRTFGSLDAYDGAGTFMRWLGENHELTIVTHRSTQVAPLTFKWLAHHRVPAQAVHIIPNDVKKSEIANALGLEVFIDDKPEVVEDVLRLTDCEVFMPNRPWNADHFFARRITTRNRLHRYTSYEEVFTWLTTQ